MFSFRLKRFLFFFLPLVLITTAISLNLYNSNLKTEQQRLNSKQLSLVEFQKDSIEKTMNALMSDLMVLSSHHILKVWLNSGDSKHLNILAEEFLAFSNHKGFYDQVRILNLNGDEVIRVNRNEGSSTVIPARQLQNKRGRNYFTETMTLSKGALFTSPFDLNIEQGKIELPLNPVIRISTPIFDNNGKKRGIIILNMLGEKLLSQLDCPASGCLGKTMLINADGYWLKSINDEDKWGFMYPERADIKFQNRFPHAAKVIMSGDIGSTSMDSGLFTYAKVAAYPIPKGKDMDNQAERQHWWIISHITQDALRAATGSLRERFILFDAFFILLFAIGSWIGADSMSRHHKSEKRLMASEQRFRSVTQTAKDAIIISDGDGNIISWNSGATIIFGYEESEVMGKPTSLIMPQRYRDMHQQGIRCHKQSGHSTILGQILERHGLKKDGEEIDIRFSLSTWNTDGEHYYGAIIHDITETKKLEKQLEAMASHDGLTGLYNRAIFDVRICEELSRAQRYQHPISLIFLDIDHFKQVNDTYGHAAGDACLISVAKLLQRMGRHSDIVARYGGEEFIIILPQTDSASAHILAERLRKAAEEEGTEFNNETIAWTASFGLAALEHNWNVTVQAWIERADSALYEAKDNGRNQVRISREERA